jgi:hypothetical protein
MGPVSVVNNWRRKGFMIAAAEITQSLETNKSALVAAHRTQNWEFAKLLSQERQQLKKKRKPRCLTCGVTITKGSHCCMHSTVRRFYSNKLAGLSKAFPGLRSRDSTDCTPGTLTARQTHVVCTWVESGTVRGAAAKLGLSEKTVEYHLAMARRRAGLGRGPLLWLAIWAIQNGVTTFKIKGK